MLVLEEDGRGWIRAALSAGEPIALQRELLAESQNVPRTAIEQVRERPRPLVIDDAVCDSRVAHDPYVLARAPRSILVLPAQRQSALVATLYFENRLTTHAFPAGRVGVLDLLSTQIAIALENSLLFEKLQTALRLRDEFLSVASHELNTPMSALMLNLEELVARLARAPLDAELLGRMSASAERQGRRMTRLIGELLDVVRCEAGTFVVLRESVEVPA